MEKTMYDLGVQKIAGVYESPAQKAKTEEEDMVRLAKIVDFIIAKEGNLVNGIMEYDDLKQELLIVLLKAYRLYRSTPEHERDSGFFHYAWKCCENKIFEIYRSYNYKKRNKDRYMVHFTEDCTGNSPLNDTGYNGYHGGEFRNSYSLQVSENEFAQVNADLMIADARLILKRKRKEKTCKVFDLIVQEVALKDIATEVGTTPQTVQYHLKLIRNDLAEIRTDLLESISTSVLGI